MWCFSFHRYKFLSRRTLPSSKPKNIYQRADLRFWSCKGLIKILKTSCQPTTSRTPPSGPKDWRNACSNLDKRSNRWCHLWRRRQLRLSIPARLSLKAVSTIHRISTIILIPSRRIIDNRKFKAARIQSILHWTINYRSTRTAPWAHSSSTR